MHNIKAKLNRPAKDEKKEKRVSLRFTKTEYSNIKENANTAGNTISNFIRRATLGEKIHPKLTVEEMAVVRQLIGISNDLNKISNAFKKEAKVKEAAFFKKFRNQVDKLIPKSVPH
jgi:hypothetical protein